MIDSNGIVIPAGGERYFTCAYVAATVVRSLGCNLPIQAWCLGPTEIDNQMKSIIESIPNTTVVDVTRMEGCPLDLTPRKLKAFAVVSWPFKRTYVIDIGAIPVQINDKFIPSPVVYNRRNLFSVHYPNPREIHPYEELCFEAIEDLRSRWNGKPWSMSCEPPDKLGYASHWSYRKDRYEDGKRVIGIERILHLKWTGGLDGGSPMEGYMSLVDFRGKNKMVIGPDFRRAKEMLVDSQAPLQVLDQGKDNRWRGKWDFQGKYEIEVEPIKDVK